MSYKALFHYGAYPNLAYNFRCANTLYGWRGRRQLEGAQSKMLFKKIQLLFRFDLRSAPAGLKEAP